MKLSGTALGRSLDTLRQSTDSLQYTSLKGPAVNNDDYFLTVTLTKPKSWL